MGDGIGILPGDGLVQEQFQNLMLFKMIQPLFPEPGFQPLAMAFVNGHIFHLFVFALAIFLKFR